MTTDNTKLNLKQSDRVKPLGYGNQKLMTLNQIPQEQQDAFFNHWLNVLNKPAEDCFGTFNYSFYRDWFNGNLIK